MTDHPLDLDELLRQDDFVRSVCRSLVGPGPEAEDSAQDAWVKTLDQPKRVAGSPDRRGWLRVVARNATISRFRADRARRLREEHASHERKPIPSPAEILEREELRHRVVAAVLQLDERYRIPVVLRHFQERAPDQIAAQLGIPVETVWTRLHRSRALLRDALKADDPRQARGLAVLAGIPVGQQLSAAATVAASAKVMGKGWIMGKLIFGALVAIAILVGALFLSRDPTSAFDVADGKGIGGESALIEDPAEHLSASGRTSNSSLSRAEVTDELDEDLAEAPASIQGKVIDEGGTPIDGASVRSVESQGLSATAVETRTDDEGRFDLPTGLLGAKVQVDARGRIAKEVRIWPGEHPEIVLHLGIEVRGRVIDKATGAPIAGAEVKGGLQSATSDAAGRFTIHMPSVTRYFSVVAGEAYVQWAASPFFAEENRDLVVRLPRMEADEFRYLRIVDGRDGEPVSEVTASTGPCESLGNGLWRVGFRTFPSHGVGNIQAIGYMYTVVEALDERGRMPSDPIEVRLVTAAVLRGEVVDLEGRLIVGAEVSLRMRALNPVWGHSRVPRAVEWRAITDPAGRFTIEGPPPFHEGAITVTHPSFGETRDVVSTALDAIDTRVVMNAGRVLTGRVERAGDGAPVEGAMVHFDETHVAITGFDGRFRLGGLPEEATVTVRAADLAARRFYDVRTTPSEEAGEEPDEERVLSLEGIATISGRVVDENGALVAFATVRARGGRLDAEKSSGSSLSVGLPQCVADGNGRFVFSALASGEWYLDASPPDMSRNKSWNEARFRTGQSGVTLTAHGLTGVAFRVLDETTGEPVSPIYCFGPTGSVGGQNANASTFLEMAPDRPGTIGVSAAGYAPEIRTGVAVAPGEIRVEVFRLAPARDLHGSLVDERSRPIGGASLVLRPTSLGEEDSVDVTVVSDRDGAFVARGVVPGDWRVVSCVVSDPSKSTERSLRVRPESLSLSSTDTEVTLVAESLPGRAVVRGYVTLMENTVRAAVILNPHGIRVPVDEQGYFVAECVPSGVTEVALECNRGDNGTATRDVAEIDVPEVGTLDVDLRKRP